MPVVDRCRILPGSIPVPGIEGLSSTSLRSWHAERAARLDEIESAQLAIGRTRRGRRGKSHDQLNHAYVVLLCSQFQGFCRDLHSECVDFVVRSVVAAPMQATVRAEFWRSRRLDRGNPTAEAIGSDFSRLGLDFWRIVVALDRRNLRRKARVDELVAWRNAIAHQDFVSHPLTPEVLDLSVVRGWRRSCGTLARSFDRSMTRYLVSVLGTSPW